MTDDMKTDTQSLQVRYAMVPLRDVVIFPHMVIPLFVGREKSCLLYTSDAADE